MTEISRTLDTLDTLDTLYGLLSVPDWQDDLIVRSLRILGEWCAAEAILAADLLDPGEALWDAGAFLGTFSLGVAAQTAPARVVAIEANPDLAEALARNLALLPCSANLVSSGLSARPGWLVPTCADSNNHGATAYHHTDQPPDSGPAIRCRTLPDLRREFGDYDLLKLDLEGMELDALRGDFPYLKARKPMIWAECNENHDSLHLLSALKWLKYDVLYVAFPAFRADNFRGATNLIYPMAYEAALVAGPAERLQRLAGRATALVPRADVMCRPIATAYDLRRALFDTPRWSRADWAGMSRAELIARLGRQQRGETLKSFLLLAQSL